MTELLKSSKDENIKNALKLVGTDWGFDSLKFSEIEGVKNNTLFLVAHHIFIGKEKFHQSLPFDELKFGIFLLKIQEQYRNVKYHSALHACNIP